MKVIDTNSDFKYMLITREIIPMGSAWILIN
jgi:hypothetical protein